MYYWEPREAESVNEMPPMTRSKYEEREKSAGRLAGVILLAIVVAAAFFLAVAAG